VDKPSTKPVIGILGGVASGKSTVAAEFAKLGCAVIDADKIAHKVLDRKNVRDKITGSFGNGILDSTGKIDRQKLADIAFADSEKLSTLNNIVHPYVLARAEQLMDEYSRQEQVKAIVLDMPLLVAVGWAKRCDKLIFVDCEAHLRLDRAKKMGICEKVNFQSGKIFKFRLTARPGSPIM